MQCHARISLNAIEAAAEIEELEDIILLANWNLHLPMNIIALEGLRSAGCMRQRRVNTEKKFAQVTSGTTGLTRAHIKSDVYHASHPHAARTWLGFESNHTKRQNNTSVPRAYFKVEPVFVITMVGTKTGEERDLPQHISTFE